MVVSCQEASERHEWKIEAIEVVAKIEHAGKSRTRELRLHPRTGRIAIGVAVEMRRVFFGELRGGKPVERADEIGILMAEDLDL